MILLLFSIFVKKESDDKKELSKRQPQEYEGPNRKGPTWHTIINSQNFKILNGFYKKENYKEQ